MAPWNPQQSLDVTPAEYEQQVVEWLRATGVSLMRFDVRHLEHLRGAGGDYEFDAVAEFSILEGARVALLIECKRYSKPVEREKLLALWAKLQDVKAHKALIFSTSGFQSGALEYASAYGIATVTFIEGKALYQTRAAGHVQAEPPPWAQLPRFAGMMHTSHDDCINSMRIDGERIEPLSKWLGCDAA